MTQRIAPDIFGNLFKVGSFDFEPGYGTTTTPLASATIRSGTSLAMA